MRQRPHPLPLLSTALLALGLWAGVAKAQTTSFNWVSAFGGTSWDAAEAVATDGSGNVCICGEFSGMVSYGAYTLTSAGTSDGFVASYSSAGAVLWAKKIGGAINTCARSIAIAPDGSVYVAGYGLDSSISYGSPTTQTVNRIYVNKYDPAGHLLWSLRPRGRGDTRTTGLAISKNGRFIYVVGTVTDTLSAGAFSLPAGQYKQALIMRVDSNGAVRWIRTGAAGANSHDGTAVNSACTDDQNRLYFCGGSVDTLSFGGIRLGTPMQSSSMPFVASYDSTGKAQWARSYTQLGSVASSVRFAQKTLYLTSPSALAMKLELTGTMDRLLLNNGGTIGAEGLATDGIGNIYLSGTLANINLNVGNVKVNSVGVSCFILKLDSSFRPLWYDVTNNGTVSHSALAVDTAGHRFIAGAFRDSVRFDATNLGAKQTDGFLALLAERSMAVSLPDERVALCPGDSIAVTVKVTSEYFKNNIFTVELSDSLGRFALPTVIGRVAGTTTCSVVGVTPSTLPSGNHYRIRVRSSIPAMTSLDNGTDLSVATAPLASLDPPGAVDICEEDSVRLTARGGAQYLWSTGDTTSSIVVHQDGIYSVYVMAGTGCGARPAPVHVQVHPLPPVPGIRRSGQVLTSTSPTHNQWSLNGTPIPGATGQTFTVTQNGIYNVTVSDDIGCSSVSDDFPVDLKGVPDSPAGRDLHLAVNGTTLVVTDDLLCGPFDVTIFDVLGRVQYQTRMSPEATGLDLSSVPACTPGAALFIRVTDGRTTATLKYQRAY